MMKKRFKMTISVVALAAVCGAYIGIKNHTAENEKEQQKEEVSETEILSVSDDEIERIEFVIDNVETEFEKTEEGWKNTSDENFPVNSGIITETVEKLMNMTSDRVLDDITDLQEYGLEVPSNTVSITDEQGNITVLKIGNKNDAVDQYYVIKEEEPDKVYMVDTSVIELFYKKLYDYAEADTFPAINSSEIKELSVEGENSDYSLSLDEDTQFWYITQDNISEKADSAKAINLVSSVSTLSYENYMDYDADEEEFKNYGLEEPYAVIKISYEEEKAETEETENSDDDIEQTEEVSSTETEDSVIEEKTLVLNIGAKADQTSRYVSIDNSKEVYTMSTDVLETFLGKNKEDFIDLTVSYYTVNNLTEMNVVYDGEENEFYVSRETSENEEGEETETVTYLKGDKEIDSTDFLMFYNKLINMSGQKRLKDTKITGEPEMKVIFKGDTGNMEVAYYNYDTNFYAAVQGENTYLVNKMTVKELFTAYEDILEN